MFRTKSRRNTVFSTGFITLELIFHDAIRNIRKSHASAVLGLLMTIGQSVLMIIFMYFLFSLLGVRRVAVHGGDFLLFVMSGVFMYRTHVSTLAAVSGADGPTSAMMMHAPMNPIISIMGAALASLYRQTISAIVILFLYHALLKPISIPYPLGVLEMHILAWTSGVGIGMVFRSIRPWQPDLATLLTTFFTRINMIASGKMMAANYMAPTLRSWFDWNPLFHIVDISRADFFVNYVPRYTSVSYAVYFTLVVVVIGLMAEFFTRQHASESWGKRR